MDINQTKVLLIEDDAIVQHVHTFMLTKLNCHVDIAVNGKDALELVETNPHYHIIFVDIGLPDISGFEVIKQLDMMKKNSQHFARIVALTGYTGEAEEKACKLAGATQIIYKPVVIQTMRTLIENTRRAYFPNNECPLSLSLPLNETKNTSFG